MQTLRLGYAFARSSLLIFLAHRLRYLIGVFNYVVYTAVSWYLCEAVFQKRDGAIATWGLQEMQTYVSINWIVRSTYFSNSDNILAARINKGEIVSDLLRPSSLLLQFYSAAVGELIFRALFMGLPVLLLVIGIFGLLPPASVFDAACFVFSVVLAFHLFFAINFLTGMCAAFTEKLQGFIWAKFVLIQFLSGQFLPLDFYPASVKAVFDWLPFKGIGYTPMSIYLGRWDSTQIANELALQAGWTIVLIVGCELAWRGVRRRMCVLGG